MDGSVCDVIIIGGGPSGYTAAIYNSRAKLLTLVIAGVTPGGQLMLTTEVENYPGFSKGILGPELMQEMTNQAERFGSKLLYENVSQLELSGKIKKVWVGETIYQAKAVIMTVGAKERMLNVGEEKLIGRGVSMCATCDAAFFKGKVTYIVGGGDAAMGDALALSKFAVSVTLIHRKTQLRASKIMQDRVLVENKLPVLWEHEVVGVKSETVDNQERLTGIKVKDLKTGIERDLPAEGLFLAIGHLPATEFLMDKLEVDDHGFIVTKGIKDGVSVRKEWLDGYPTSTSIEGVFAAGDVVDFRYKQAVTAAGMGCQAALDVEKYLTGKISGW